MKQNSKVLGKIVIVIVVLLFAILINTSEATGWTEIIDGADGFLQTGKVEAGKNNVWDSKTTRTIVGDIYNILFPIGVVVTVVVGGMLGIKFMMASVEDKAKVKESMVPYAIGCIVIYGAFGIWKLAMEIFSGLG